MSGLGPAEEWRFLRIGGVLAVLGGLGYFLTLLLHGDLPDQTAALALEHIAGRPEWPALKLVLIVLVLLWIGAFLALAHSMPHGPSWLLSRFAVASLVVGASFVMVEYSILGYGRKDVADAWAAATGPERAAKLLVGEAMPAITGGLFLIFVAWLIGLPYLRTGLAVVHGDTFARWPDWIAVVAGAGALVAETSRFLGVDVVPFPVLYGGFIVPLSLWPAAMGLLMWRRARTLAPDWKGGTARTHVYLRRSPAARSPRSAVAPRISVVEETIVANSSSSDASAVACMRSAG